MKAFRRIRKLFAMASSESAEGILARHRQAFASAAGIVQAYYAAAVFIVIGQLDLWDRWRSAREIEPLWPLTWISLTGIELAAWLVLLLALGGNLAAAWRPERRIFRILAFIGFFEFAAFDNSFGKINHLWHACVWIGFFLMALPDGERSWIARSITRRQLYLTVVWAAQAVVLIFYSMAGGWKVLMAAVQLWRGQIHAFHPDAFALQILAHWSKLRSDAPLGPYLIEHSFLGWPLYVAGIYLEFFAFIAIFRPLLHKVWGLGLILFHMGTHLILGISFSPNVLLLGLFMIGSPFAPSRQSWRETLRALPIFGFLA